MNRRTFITAGIAAFAFSSQRAFAQIDVNMLSGTRFTSELTGAEIDLGRSGLELMAQMFNDENGDELITFGRDTILGSVRFVPTGTDAQSYLDKRFAAIDDQSQLVELLGTGVMDDGGWLALSTLSSEDTNYAMYLEFQLQAFPGYDLEVFMSTDPESFHEGLELIQAVLVEGMEPFLFTQESDVANLAFPIVAASVPSSRTGRTSNSSRSGSGSRTTGSNISGGSNTSSADADPDTVIEAVRSHQAQFMDELDTFYGVVDALIDEDSTSESELTLFTDLMDLMFAWIMYPDEASALVFPPELSSLESAYFEWSDSVGEMGATMSAWMLGDGEIDAFMDAIEVGVQLNSVLSAELRTLGIVIRPAGQGFARPNDDISYMLKRHESSILAA